MNRGMNRGRSRSRSRSRNRNRIDIVLGLARSMFSPGGKSWMERQGKSYSGTAQQLLKTTNSINCTAPLNTKLYCTTKY